MVLPSSRAALNLGLASAAGRPRCRPHRVLPLNSIRFPDKPGSVADQRRDRGKHDIELEEADMAPALEAMAPHLEITTDGSGIMLAFAAAADIAARRVKIKIAEWQLTAAPLACQPSSYQKERV